MDSQPPTDNVDQLVDQSKRKHKVKIGEGAQTEALGFEFARFYARFWQLRKLCSYTSSETSSQDKVNQQISHQFFVFQLNHDSTYVHIVGL